MWMMFFGVAAIAVAQEENSGDDKPDGGRLEAMKIAWLTKKLNLSPEEAQKFWPIYNQYNKEIHKSRVEARANKIEEVKSQQQILDIRKKYEGEFTKALSKEKANAFFRAERELLVEIQKRLIERRQNKQPNRRKLN